MAKKPPVYRPVKRYKAKTRGVHVNKVEVLLKGKHDINHFCSPNARFFPDCEEKGEHEHIETVEEWVGRDPENWVRFYPNPGYRRKNGNHWCKKYGRHAMAPRSDG